MSAAVFNLPSSQAVSSLWTTATASPGGAGLSAAARGAGAAAKRCCEGVKSPTLHEAMAKPAAMESRVTVSHAAGPACGDHIRFLACFATAAARQQVVS
eukprot:CAMPEP_0178371508 /NCGR_PEP_ID=MMETSP0689_2-20121128/862_1 /TAXON_ID=160604 /ORGANISM="Amphidinium massartii, Strain CS-259" /LENGTH=98 /DNA_ID=CAMNT_0019991379 /DNA_START=749 /DNA_END=1045 /DNA_ORIENTATION=+